MAEEALPTPFSASTSASYSAQAFHARMQALSASVGGLKVAAVGDGGGGGGGGGDGGVLARAGEALAALEAASVPAFDPEAEALRVMRPLTGEEAARVRELLSGSDADAQLSLIEGNRFTAREAWELKPRVWLTDGTINVFLLALRALAEAALERGAAAAHRHVWVHNTFFWAKLQGTTGKYDYEGVSSWTRKKKRNRGVDLFAYKRVLVPINRQNTHWALALIDVERRTVAYLDSLRGSGFDVITALCRYMDDEHRDKKGGPLPRAFAGAAVPYLLPRQLNGVDCGAFLCAFCELLVRGVEPTQDVFTQDDLPYWRKRILLTCAGHNNAPCVLDG
jgi:hypothetical protein